MKICTAYFIAPIGIVKIRATDSAVVSVTFVEEVLNDFTTNQITNLCVLQLREYFNGERMKFDIPYTQQGTAFQSKVWKSIEDTSFGHTLTYSDIATNIGSPKAVRSVGTACGKNNIAIIVPCHRAISKSGHILNYAFGPEKKEWLLRHEGILQ